MRIINVVRAGVSFMKIGLIAEACQWRLEIEPLGPNWRCGRRGRDAGMGNWGGWERWGE